MPAEFRKLDEDPPHIHGDWSTTKRGTELGAQMSAITSTGQLLPDVMILDILKGRVEKGIEEGERGFLLDGFREQCPG